ncbi:hypothetical protein ABFW99_007510 [Gracilimonas sp. BCB1]
MTLPMLSNREYNPSFRFRLAELCALIGRSGVMGLTVFGWHSSITRLLSNSATFSVRAEPNDGVL